jgi:hypothetical protein
MKKTALTHKNLNRGWLLLSLLLVMMMLFTTAGTFAPVAGPARAQSALLQLAVRQPTRLVDVIIQMTGANPAGLEDEIVHAGGKVTARLSIIRALAAEIPAAGVVQLAAAPQVRWISLDKIGRAHV